MTMPDKPWVMRTYSGHSSARASNELYRTNLAKGQTGLSVAFDLPTQTGYDADHPMARGEVGRVGVPIGHLDDMRALFEGIPLERLNTSMTINATAMWLLALDAVRTRESIPHEDFPRVVGRISFFCNAGIRFVEEMCKMRAFGELWDRITRERYGVKDERFRRFRYGVQVNSLGLTALQPENNVYRILLEALAVTLSKDARARSLQLPAWNEALGLPRPWDQQWSLRLQQILAYETDLLEYEDLFDGSHVVEKRTRELCDSAKEELARVLKMGGAVAAVESAYMKQQLVAANTRRLREIESGERTVVGVN